MESEGKRGIRAANNNKENLHLNAQPRAVYPVINPPMPPSSKV